MNAVEVANSGNQRTFDALAWAYAKKVKAPATAGSDIHLAASIRDETVFGVYLEKKIETIGDYVKAIKNNAIAGLKFPAGRCDLQGDEVISVPVNNL
jgi:hypothetical protein